MNRKAKILYHGKEVGLLEEVEEGYAFLYRKEYLESPHFGAISKTLPLQEKPFISNILFPFFDGLIPEGWLLSFAERNWKLNGRDRMGLLLHCCQDCIGAVSVMPYE
ncbi:HipA N-terminal domain-containing protein [Persicobacter diffluens]|uniref:Phosphatidylinositol kinase n=1 Tax=Persicobacter diffluens TaxID=981 RepID=A0AAN4W4Y8_9BACT|nr:phosphatidylinositol kinase [Persicobacter diffluens]